MPQILARPTDAKARRPYGGLLLAVLAFGFCLVAPLLRASLSTAPARPRAAQSDKPAGSAVSSKPELHPNLLLVTVDTLRPDALGWVAGKNDTPAFDAYAAEGVRFAAAISPVPLTLPAHAAILSGLLPRRNGVRDDGSPLPEGISTLAERLAGSGYSTAAFVSGAPLESVFGLDRGFALYDDRLTEGGETRAAERRAFDTTTAALAWIATARSPWFVWVHYNDAHAPYEPPQSFLRGGPRGAYDGEVAYVDAWLARLRAGLPAAASANLLTVLASDHGESLGEHREKTHGLFLYDATTLVPLVFHFPGRLKPAASREPARLIDIAPTALDLLGAAPLPGTDGVSLKALLEGKPQSVPAAYLETRLPWTRFGWAPSSALRDGAWKLVAAPRAELFDLAQDAGEGTNRIDAERPVARRLAAALQEIEKRPVAHGPRGTGSEAARRALGERETAENAVPPAGLPDAKDRLDLHDRLEAGDEALREGRFAAALAAFDAALAAEPGNRYAALRSGTVLLETGRMEEAAKRLTRAVELDPEGPEARQALATALSRLGRFRAAVPHWAALARRQPRRADAWASLGAALGRTGNPADLDRAAAALSEAARLDPANPRRRSDLADAHLALARRALGQGARTAARRSLLSAVEIDPKARDRAAADPKLAGLAGTSRKL